MPEHCPFFSQGPQFGNALQAVRSARNLTEASKEQRRNFTPYKQTNVKQKASSWTVTIVCLSNTNDIQVPCNATLKVDLINAGLGEKRTTIPDISCSKEDFYHHILSLFPKLKDAGGFELLRCIQNSKTLQVISNKLNTSVVKSIIGSGKLYVRPIQKNLSIEPEMLVIHLQR